MTICSVHFEVLPDIIGELLKIMHVCKVFVEPRKMHDVGPFAAFIGPIDPQGKGGNVDDGD